MSQNLGRCGPEWGGRCNKDLADYAVYCNVENGWCGASDDHKLAQEGDEYDWQPKTCKSKMYHILLINKPFSKILILNIKILKNSNVFVYFQIK